MIKSYTTEIGEPTQAMLIDLRKHAAVPDKSQDALLMSYLRKAVAMVQDAADLTIVPETITIEVTERDGNEPIRLYKTVDEVVSVKDGQGNALDYQLNGCWVWPAFFTREVVIVYKTKPSMAASMLLYNVSDYAANLYAGATPEELAKCLLSL